MIYLKQFDTVAEYNAYTADTANFVTPNVSLIEETHGVAYHPLEPTPPTPTHEYVDFGLPSGTKWATMNIGASNPTAYGNYYQYGKGADDFSVTSGDSYYEGLEDPLATSADTAAQVMGGSWHTPTQAQWQELINQCTWVWTTSGGTSGYSISKNEKSIFLPAAGGWNFDGDLMEVVSFDVGSKGYYWTSSPYNFSDANGFNFSNSSKNVKLLGIDNGFSVRGVIG